MRAFALPVTILTTAAILFQAATPAYACSCVAMTPQEQIDRADVVVSGRVVDVALHERGEGPSRPQPDLAFDTFRLTIAVEQYYKGDEGATVTVREAGFAAGTFNGGISLLDSAMCGVFEGDPTGDRFLLFLHQHPDEPRFYQTTICSGSTRLADAEHEAWVEDHYGFPAGSLSPRSDPGEDRDPPVPGGDDVSPPAVDPAADAGGSGTPWAAIALVALLAAALSAWGALLRGRGHLL